MFYSESDVTTDVVSSSDTVAASDFIATME